jgi:predicted HicB family RNase H-like nuclease
LTNVRAEDKTPEVPYKGTFNVRVSSELHKRVALFANDNDKKLNKVVSEALEEYLTHV